MDSREKIIEPYIKGKKVLDLGVGDTDYRFLHKFIKENSKFVLGVEIENKRAEKLIKEGYNIKIGNAENIDLKEKFDVVIAGDLIEHLDNPGMFLNNVKKHLRKKGIFICNTPNIYSFNFIIRGLIFGGKVSHFKEHTIGFTNQLLTELFSRHNLRIKKTIYFTHNENKIGNAIIRIAGSLRKGWHENIILISELK